MLLNDALLGRVIDTALSRGADFAEIYLEDTRRRQFSYLDRQPQKAISGHSLGAGIRLFLGTEQIYTYTNDLSEEGLTRAALQAAAALKAGAKNLTFTPGKLKSFGAVTVLNSSAEKQWSRLREMDQSARGVSGLITQVSAEMGETLKHVQVFNSEGVNRFESRSYLNTFVFAFAEEHGQKDSSFERHSQFGGTSDSGQWDEVDFKGMAVKAAEQGISILHADWAPAGEMPVLVSNRFGGVIFHEACGHGLETTSVAKNASVFCGMLGKKVANECVTAIDDGTIAGQNGTLQMDDEGQETERTVLIEKGILKSYIVDKIGARKTGYRTTGSGRRQDYRFAPTSRMRNTFIDAGTSSFDEMIKDIDYGLFASKLGGGSVSPGTGSYNFAVREGFIVRNGKIEKQVKGASLIGTGIETLGRIVKVGSDMDLAPGTCGSISGMIPTTVGQPSILVEKLTVGGKA